jgi:hypothetical protein
MEKNWIAVSEHLPEPIQGKEGKPPTISDDVVILFENGDVDIAMYDHEDDRWTLPNSAFAEPDCEPVFWMELPPSPSTTQPARAGRGDSSET